MTIPKPSEKIKPRGAWGQGMLRIAAEAVIFLLLLCVAFMLGRISALSGFQKTSEIKVIYPPLVSTNVPKYNADLKVLAPSNRGGGTQSVIGGMSEETSESDTWSFAASKTGKVYYPKDCGSLNRVKPENRVYFASGEQAESAGYTRSSACAE